jgi:hypothetical protein
MKEYPENRFRRLQETTLLEMTDDDLTFFVLCKELTTRPRNGSKPMYWKAESIAERIAQLKKRATDLRRGVLTG